VLLGARASESLRHFYAKRLTRIGIPLLFWSVFYLIYANRDVAPALALTRALVALAAGNPYFHLYFLFVLLGLYLFVPVFRAVTQNVSRKHLTTGAAVCLVMASSDAVMRGFVGARLNVMSLFVPYIGYFFLGFALRNTVLPHPAERRCRVLFLLAIAATAGGTGFAVSRWGIAGMSLFLYDSFSPTVIVMSVSLFLLFSTAASRQQKHSWFSGPALSSLSAATLGIYLLHPFFLSLLLRNGVLAGALTPWVHLTVSILVPFIGSLLVTVLLRRMGPLKLLTG
jgi:surface polysaccharide O-acyltransferase-like enzyme